MIFPLISQSISSNSYIIVDKKSLIVDPGISVKELITKIHELKTQPDFILLTHCHYDHVIGTPYMKEKTNSKVLAHELCAKFLEVGDDTFIHAGLFNALPVKIKVDQMLKDEDIIDLGNMKLEVMHTPGHSPGSICLYEEKTKSLFSGDTIFKEGIGRTDLPGGDFNLLKKSIERLIKLHETRGIKKIYPGHGLLGSGGDIEKIYEWYFFKKNEHKHK
jgi:glyoxylase-like metal-dependent hydrolase (beta-lactamase superfamily II)